MMQNPVQNKALQPVTSGPSDATCNNHALFVVAKTSIGNNSSGSNTVMVSVILCLSVLNPFCFITVSWQ